MTGADERPRPQYGEYATPEEVAEITGRHPHAAEPAEVHPGTNVPVAASDAEDGSDTRARAEDGRSRTAATSRAAAPAAAPPTAQDSVSPPRVAPEVGPTGRPVPRFRADRPLAWGLLVLGGLDFLIRVGDYLDFGAAMRRSVEAFSAFGYGEFDAVGLANALGPWIGITHLVLLVATLLLTIAAARRWRTVFWIPLVGAVVWNVAQSVFILAILFQDPGYREMLAGVGG